MVRHSYAAIALICLASVWFAWQIPALRFKTAIYDMAIEDLDDTVYYRNFKKQFGTEEIIFVVLQAENIFDPHTFSRIARIADQLSRIDGVRQVLSLPGIRADMDVTSKWSISDFEERIEPVTLFRKNFISPDQSKTVISLLLDDGADQGVIIQGVEEAIQERGDDLSVYQIGMPLVSEALASYTRADFMTLPPITFLVIGVVLFILFRSIRGVLVPAASVSIALTWTLGLMAWTGTAFSFLTMIVPVFLIAVGTAYCMHIMSEYYRAAEHAGTPSEAVVACFQQVGFPTTLAVITTIIGIGALLTNQINNIREFALFSCFGMLSMLAAMLIFMPALLSLLPLPRGRTPLGGPLRKVWDRFLERIVRVNLQHQRIMLLVLGAVGVAAVAGIFFIHVETNPVDFFKKDTPISQHFTDIHRDLAGSFPVNVVLDGKVDGYFELPDHLKQVETIQNHFDGLQGVDKTTSFVDFLKLVNYATNKYDEPFYTLPKEPFEVRMLMNSYKSMLGQDAFERFMSEDYSRINILLRTHISSSERFLDLRQEIETYLQANFAERFDYHVTGLGVVISQSSRLLTEGQMKSLSLTLILIFGVMGILFLSTKVGLIAVVPNCFPIAVNFGLMGWMGIDLSVTTSLIASIAIGLAVDDTIHYMARYNREFKRDLDKDRALRDTIRAVGIPIIFTTLAISLGFSILMFSHFKPTAVFGLLMMVTMASALIGDLIILPSLMRHAELVTAWDLLKLMPSLGGVSAGMAHELMQPLNAIKMGSEFLRMMIQQGGRVPEDQLKEVVNEIGVQVDRASETVGRLREFGRHMDLEKREVDVNESIEDILAILEPQLRLDNIRVERDLAPQVPPVLGHPNRIGQVIYNLMINARDAVNEKGGLTGSTSHIIRIASVNLSDRVIVSVTDSGTGIEPHLKDRIFEPFVTTRGEGKGRGLGLSITSEIVRDHGGRIYVETETSKGTTVTVEFPLFPSEHKSIRPR